ncbi:MAG: hypothetical protein ACI857_002939 [Arenicella sp.]|jgi:hypothetical protein
MIANMKVKKLILATVLLTAASLYGQVPKDFIKDYKAPDFKLRYLDLALSGRSAGKESQSVGTTGTTSSMWGRATQGWISNNQKYQGNFRVHSSFFGALKTDSTFALPRTGFSVTTSGSHRWYKNSALYIGFHENSILSLISWFNQKDIDIDRHFLSLNLNPALSLGFGRVEYVSFARQTIDVNRLLERSGRLKNSLDKESATILANRLTELNYKRGYDPRLLRIWQLEQLDSTLSSLDVVTKQDMRYMAALSDAFVFANSSQRLSGFRMEWGLAQQFTAILSNSNTDLFSDNYFSGGYVSLNAYIPSSYAFQHDVGVSVLAGGEYDLETEGEFRMWTNAHYVFGWYPNTRTSLKSSLAYNVSVRDNGFISGDSRLALDFNYYISPRTRFNVSGAISSNENYIRHNFLNIPSGFLARGQFNSGYLLTLGITHSIF